MKISVLSGSPKGNDSISLQYLYFIKKHNPDIDFSIFHIGSSINLIRNSEEKLFEISETIKNSDAIIWVMPVYEFSIPAQMKEFIDLISSSKLSHCFKNKKAASIFTSIHFYDTVAVDYIHAVSEDLNMNFFGAFSAEMHDLKKENGKNSILEFWNDFYFNIKNNILIPKKFSKDDSYTTAFNLNSEINLPKKSDKRIVMITTNESNSGNLKNMITHFTNSCSYNIDVLNLDKINIKGACLGCCHCSYDNTCIYIDELSVVYKEKIKNADALIIASNISNRYFHHKIKLFWDRSFVFGHTPFIKNKIMAYIVSGNISQSYPLNYEIDARASAMESYTLPIISDEFFTQDNLSAFINQSAELFSKAILENKKTQKNFHYIASHKIFRDFVHTISGVFRADYIYYKKNKLFDFPNKNPSYMIFNFILRVILKIPGFRKEFQKRIKPSMVAQFKKIAE